MSYLEEADQILKEAEQSLRSLIERALSDQRYGDVAAIAQIADSVARFRRGEADGVRILGESKSGNDAHPSDHAGQSRVSSRSGRGRRAARAAEFPRFERDGDKLVKVGWSRRDEWVYEHRAPREVVFLVSTAISNKVKPKAVFTMDQVLPVNDTAGNEVPSYQAYLALAWLRSLGVVQRKGKEGYALTNGVLDRSKLQRLWNSVPDRQ